MRDEPAAVQRLLSAGRAHGLWRSGIGYRHYCRTQLFPGVDFSGLSMLDIGCGNGLFSLWAAAHGAERVVAVEPVAAGSTGSGEVEALKRLKVELAFDNIALREVTFQHFEERKAVFDLVFLHYSINHLDEAACIRLKDDPDARASYVQLFSKMLALLRPGGSVVLVDCSDRNFWNDIGLTSPWAREIEWFKHQAPELWAELLEDAGFRGRRVSWTYDNRLLHLGALLKNRAAAYFYTSIFRLEMRSPSNSRTSTSVV